MNEVKFQKLECTLQECMAPHLEESKPLRELVRRVGQLLVEMASECELLEEEDTVSVDRVVERKPKFYKSLKLDLELGDAEPVSVLVPDIPQASNNDVPETPSKKDAVVDDEHSKWQDHKVEDYRLDLELLLKRCQLKAEACFLFIKKDKGDLKSHSGEWKEKREALIQKARAITGCFLAALHYKDSQQPGPEVVQTVGNCYYAVADALELLRVSNVQDSCAPNAENKEILQLAAEAASMLRVALPKTWPCKLDVDQDELFKWISAQTTKHSFFLKRFMTMNDSADPDDVSELRERMQDLLEQIGMRKKVNALFNKIAWHVPKPEVSCHQTPSVHDCDVIVSSIKHLGEDNCPYSNSRYRDVLDSTMVEYLQSQDTFGPYVQKVLDTLREYFDSQVESATASDDGSNSNLTDDVHEVRNRLNGRQIVIIGGESKPYRIENIQSAFHPSIVKWVKLEKHGPSTPMNAPIARPETALVIGLVRFTGHAFLDQARVRSKECDKPFVRVTAGYSPNQIAAAVLNQVSLQFNSCDSALVSA